ncbi:MAG: sugar transferase [Firmicutes bacterium]|nr:sugar transferase [Bacillota bacterium]
MNDMTSKKNVLSNKVFNLSSFFDLKFRILKRTMDIFFSLIGLIVTFPLVLLIVVLIKLETKGPWLYKQDRIGVKGRKFTIYKLRSMFKDAEKDGIHWTEENDPRVTKIGKFIRKTRIDEIPQLFNILIGDMSIVGPRPERPFFIKIFNKELPMYKERLTIKPGLTGLAQVNGGYNLTPKEKLHLDLYYIKNKNLLVDIKIIIKTIKVIFTLEGAR